MVRDGLRGEESGERFGGGGEERRGKEREERRGRERWRGERDEGNKRIEGFRGQEGREEEVVVRREIQKTRVGFDGSGYGCERSKRGLSAPWPGVQTAHAGKSRATPVDFMTASAPGSL